MTIDKEKLISLLKEKTGLERAEVESQLSELISRIQQAADQGKTFQIEGFGTFSMEEGTLHFDPNDRLETEINNKYAGMKPIELIGAFKEPEGDEEVPEMAELDPEADEKWEFDTAEADEGLPEEEDEDVEEIKADLQEEPDAPDADATEEDPDEVFDAVFGAPEDTSDDEIAFEEDDETVDPSESDLQDTESTDTIGRILVAAVVIISLGISSWVIYDLSYSESSPGQNSAPATEQAQQMAQSEDESEQPEEEPEESAELEEESEVPTQEESQTQLNDGQKRYGLHGMPNESIESGYTIVVHSLQEEQKAEQNRQRLQEAGFRALINEAQVQGSTYYRVGIGQFETISAAQEAIEEIPEEYSQSNFIRRIQ